MKTKYLSVIKSKIFIIGLCGLSAFALGALYVPSVFAPFYKSKQHLKSHLDSVYTGTGEDVLEVSRTQYNSMAKDKKATFSGETNHSTAQDNINNMDDLALFIKSTDSYTASSWQAALDFVSQNNASFSILEQQYWELVIPSPNEALHIGNAAEKQIAKQKAKLLELLNAANAQEKIGFVSRLLTLDAAKQLDAMYLIEHALQKGLQYDSYSRLAIDSSYDTDDPSRNNAENTSRFINLMNSLEAMTDNDSQLSNQLLLERIQAISYEENEALALSAIDAAARISKSASTQLLLEEHLRFGSSAKKHRSIIALQSFDAVSESLMQELSLIMEDHSLDEQLRASAAVLLISMENRSAYRAKK